MKEKKKREKEKQVVKKDNINNSDRN